MAPLLGEFGQLVHRSPDGHFSIYRAIMSTFPAEAIVNATDRYMTINTSNVRGAEFQITHAAGSELRNHLHYNYPMGLRTGDALATPSFEMPNCYYIIHVNGPNYNTKTKSCLPLLKQQLADCYRRCMEEAFRLGVKSIAFPCVSTGSMGWPRAEAARIGVATVRAWLRHPIHGDRRQGVIERVAFLADPVGRHADQEHAWAAAFRLVALLALY
jgi:O-acetyl-ADP-ribose deacetylase